MQLFVFEGKQGVSDFSQGIVTTALKKQ